MVVCGLYGALGTKPGAAIVSTGRFSWNGKVTDSSSGVEGTGVKTMGGSQTLNTIRFECNTKS